MKSQTLDSVITGTIFAVALGAAAAIVVVSGTSAEAASNTGEVIEHEDFTVASNLDAGVTEFKPTSGKRTGHFSCEVDDAETGTLVIGDSTVSSSTYGEKLVAGEKFGGPHGREYGRALAADPVSVHCRFVVSGVP